MQGLVTNIETATIQNSFFRHVLYTGPHSQLVVMTLKPNEDIGMEVHNQVDQFLRIEKGTGKVLLNGEEHVLVDGDAISVPAGTEHNVINTSETEPLKL
jgi:mannose-6-phosphate isomerase-like protein (cupin superfamily)